MQTVRRLLMSSVACLSLMALGCSNENSEAVIAADGVEIRFDHRGHGNPALVFVHGWANDRSVWDAQVAHFSRTYEVVNADLPSFGESGNNRESYTMASFGHDIATVLRKLELEQVVLIGFSMGAPVVLEAANRAPKRVLGVVLVDELHDVDAKVTPTEVSDTAKFLLDLVANPTNEKLVNSGFYTKNEEESFKKVAAMLKDAPRIGWEDSLLDALNWLNEDCTGALSRVQAPIISINSDLMPTNVEAFRKYAPSFQAKIVPDTGHLVMWDAPEEFNRLLEESIQELKSQ